MVTRSCASLDRRTRKRPREVPDTIRMHLPAVPRGAVDQASYSEALLQLMRGRWAD
jgi:hypothetical protein